jgi:hypothetical protein
MSQNQANDGGSPSTVLEYHDTIGMLQEEIARLEDALARRESEVPVNTPGVSADDQFDRELLESRVEGLNVEIASRDETIALLLEQVRLFEEAESASRAEWEQLQQWVQEVERRVEGRDREDKDLERDLQSERRNAETLRENAENDKRAWRLQRKALEQEVANLREKVTAIAQRPDSGAALQVLEHENKRLKEAYQHLTKRSAGAAELASMRERFRVLQTELDEAKRQLRQAIDERDRERNEHEVAMASLRSQQAREALNRQTEGVKARLAKPEEAETNLSPDERIKAFRQHLREIHEEEEGRKKQGLSFRLARIWGRTGPAR